MVIATTKEEEKQRGTMVIAEPRKLASHIVLSAKHTTHTQQRLEGDETCIKLIIRLKVSNWAKSH